MNIFSINCIEKTKIKKKSVLEWPINKEIQTTVETNNRKNKQGERRMLDFGNRNNKKMFQPSNQCDQIGRFIALWATFQSLLQQLFCRNRPHFQAFFVKFWTFFIFHFCATLIDIWRFLLVTLPQMHLLSRSQCRKQNSAQHNYATLKQSIMIGCCIFLLGKFPFL